MNKAFIKNISTNLVEISKSVSEPKTGDIKNLRIHDNVHYSIPNKSALAFNELVKKIQKYQDFEKKFSEKYIDKNLKTIFSKLLTDPSTNLTSELNNLFSSLQTFSDTKEIYLKVDGLTLNLCFSLGKVKLFPGDKYLKEKLEKEAWDIFKTLKHSEDGKTKIKEMFIGTINKELLGGCVSYTKVTAEPIRAYEIAKEESRLAIDILRYASKAIFPLSEDIRIGLRGEHPLTIREGFIFSKSGYNQQQDSVGSVFPFTIDENNFKRMDEVGAFKLSDILAKESINNYEEALIKCVHWYSVALMQAETCNSFLFLITALESIFLQEKGSSISGTISESVAFILSDNLVDRKSLIKLMRDYYGKRSAVTHGGKKAIPDIDLYRLTEIVGSIIMISIENANNFKSQKELMSWIEDKKLS